jgi:DNA-binding MarR family transcriptional regulator
VNGNALEARRRASQLAFGQRYRLELMLKVLESDDGLFTLSEMSRELRIAVSNIQGPIESLLALGLISRLPTPDELGVYYLRNEGAGWDWAFELSLDLDS